MKFWTVWSRHSLALGDVRRELELDGVDRAVGMDRE
jgi:hypothetical protein